jgi:hypothetical protein
MEGINFTVPFDSTRKGQGLNPPTAREFSCSSKSCPSAVALVGLNAATPTTLAVTSIPATRPKLGQSGSQPEDGDFSFNVVAVTLGVAGLIFKIFCITVFVISRRRGGGSGMNGGTPRKGISVKWWNKLPRPDFGTSELSAGPGQYETAELPGEDGVPIFELPAESIRRGLEGGRKRSQMSKFSGSSREDITDADIGLGIQESPPHPLNTAHLQTAESEMREARETTNLLPATSPSHSRSNSGASNPHRETPSQLPSRSLSERPSTPVPAPAKSKVELRGSVGVFAPRPMSELELKYLAGVLTPLPTSKPREKKYTYIYK